MKTKDLFITDFFNPVFQTMFKKYFSEIGVRVEDWEGLWSEMNNKNGGNSAYIRICDNEPAGFIQFTDITLESWFLKERLGFIREFWVDEKFRKRGYGTELLCLAEKYFTDNGIRRVVLTPEENERLFYLKRGYVTDYNFEAKNQIEVFAKEL